MVCTSELVVMLGSPVLDPMGAHPHVLLAARALAGLSAIGVPGLMDEDCLSGTCFEDNVAAATAPLQMPAVSCTPSRTESCRGG